jgi:hypothetical protein
LFALRDGIQRAQALGKVDGKVVATYPLVIAALAVAPHSDNRRCCMVWCYFDTYGGIGVGPDSGSIAMGQAGLLDSPKDTRKPPAGHYSIQLLHMGIHPGFEGYFGDRYCPAGRMSDILRLVHLGTHLSREEGIPGL